MMCPLEEGSKLLLNISNKHIHHQIMRVVLGMLHISYAVLLGQRIYSEPPGVSGAMQF